MQDTVALRVLLSAAGPVTPSDVELARTSGGIVVAFNVDVPDDAEAVAKRHSTDVLRHDVIYDLLDAVRARMEGRIKTVQEKVPSGAAEVKAVFGRGKGTAAGCLVTEGRAVARGVVEVTRGRKTCVYEGPLTSLRRFRDEVSVVEEGVECGIACAGFLDWAEGDKVTFFRLVDKTLTLEESKASVAVDFDAAMLEFEESMRAAAAGEAGADAGGEAKK